MSAPSALAVRVVEALAASGSTVACAESLTGGLLCSALVDVPGASDVVRGAVVAYATDVKAGVLGVPDDVLAEHGAVHEATARAMARGAARLMGASYAVATTGVAGPGPDEGRPAGTVFVAVGAPNDDRDGVAHVRYLRLDGDRSAVRSGAVVAALSLLLEVLEGTVVRQEGARSVPR